MSKTDKLLAVLDMTEEEQRKEIGRYFGTNFHYAKRDKWTGGDWTVIPCSKCGKQWKNWTERQKDKSKCKYSDPYKGSFADLAFRLNGGSLAGKKPIEWAIKTLVEKEKVKK